MFDKKHEHSSHHHDSVAARAFSCGKILAHSSPEEEICVTGISGAFPNSDNVYELSENLFNKKNMITANHNRWGESLPEVPRHMGAMNNVQKFDNGFFGIHYREVNALDPMARMAYEKAIEAIMDAGFNPTELAGTRTGVFAATSAFESVHDFSNTQQFGPHSYMKSFICTRLSHYLKVNGPVGVFDTACSSSCCALDEAYRCIRNGHCDAAIVCGCNMCVHPLVTLQFKKLGVLSPDGKVKCFDAEANGYVRSEAASATFLQKRKDARRIYCQMVYTKTNCDGYKDRGNSHPSGDEQAVLLDEFYNECGVASSSVAYIETHGAGTLAGDPQEIKGIDKHFSKYRKTPFLIGSLKCNIGHTECASGLSALTKVIISMETGFIPPNIYYNKPPPGVKPLEDGRLVVVTEKTPCGDLLAVNNFGIGGVNAHVLLRKHAKIKINGSQPQDDIPRLVCVSGRTEKAIDAILDAVAAQKMDTEYVTLINKVFSLRRHNIDAHSFRGYAIVSKAEEVYRSVRHFEGVRKPFQVVFGGVCRGWASLIRDLVVLPVCVARFQKINDITAAHGVDFFEILNPKATYVSRITIDLLQNLAVQIAVADILKLLGIKPDFVAGDVIGVFTAAYFEGVISIEKLTLCVYYLGLLLQESYGENQFSIDNRIHFAKATVGISSQLLKMTNNLNPEQTNETIEVEKMIGKLLYNDITINENCTALIVGSANFTGGKEVVNLVPKRKQGIVQLLDILGKLYKCGFNFDLAKLYPEVQFPVSRGTPMLSPFIKWHHKIDWFLYNYDTANKLSKNVFYETISLEKKEHEFLKGHVVDGNILFPATGYIVLVCQCMLRIQNVPITRFGNLSIVFENVKFVGPTILSSDSVITVSIAKGSGNFEILEGDTLVVTGRVYVPENNRNGTPTITVPPQEIDLKDLTLEERDVYKELKLRGYDYTDAFRGIKQCNVGATWGLVEWDDNWVAFLSSMLQMQIFGMDTRNLLVPTGIKKLKIDAIAHYKYVKQFGTKPKLPVYVNSNANIIKSGGIEITHLSTISIPRRKKMEEPVLEKYVFVPNVTTLTLEESVRVNIQIAFETSLDTKIDVIEIIDDATKPNGQAIGPIASKVLKDLPKVQGEVTMLSKNPINNHNVTLKNKKRADDSGALVVILSGASLRPHVLEEAFHVLKKDGFVISREQNGVALFERRDVQIITVHSTKAEKLFLLRRKIVQDRPSVMQITNGNHAEWLSPLQRSVKRAKDLVIYAQNEPLSGIIGLCNCIRSEPNGQNVRCVLIMDDNVPEFDAEHEFYKRQLEKNLPLNIYKNGSWGTYRHLLISSELSIESEHRYINATITGDMSSLAWTEGPLNEKSVLQSQTELVKVHYAALNFRDVMVASGTNTFINDRNIEDGVIGFEFSGIDRRGRRVMGISPKGIATLVEANEQLLWTIPDQWTLEQASTVPTVYLTVLYGIFERAKIKRGQSILIHAGTGGVGQAAIHLCSYLGCEIFTTTGTESKRQFIRDQFPQIKESRIGNSRDTSFEQMVHRETNGRGVDFVLNSLSDEKLQASVKCLAKRGHFLEIGKFDIANDNLLSMELFKKECTFHRISVDTFMTAGRNKVVKHMQELIQKNVVKPLPTHVFKDTDVEKAFRFMANGKHMGKVVIKVRDEDTHKFPGGSFLRSVPRYWCEPDSSYIVLGGLGGFGLELVDWLVLRGAKKIIVTSRKGIKNGYQSYRIRLWRSYGVEIEIFTKDTGSAKVCAELLERALKLGPIQAIFNLAAVMKSNLFENQTTDNYGICFKPKSVTTEHLDLLSRKMCPHLRDFVVFSSISGCRGNPGVTNYGMTNTAMEKICEQRKRDGFPALAIQWGAFADVGLLVDLEIRQTGGTVPQRISSCLSVMDIFLRQEETIVSCMIVPGKICDTKEAENVVESVARILGLRDLKTVGHYSTLAELGMDSMMALEVKEVLEKELEVFLTPQDVRDMTFKRLRELEQSGLHQDQIPMENRDKNKEEVA